MPPLKKGVTKLGNVGFLGKCITNTSHQAGKSRKSLVLHLCSSLHLSVSMRNFLYCFAEKFARWKLLKLFSCPSVVWMCSRCSALLLHPAGAGCYPWGTHCGRAGAALARSQHTGVPVSSYGLHWGVKSPMGKSPMGNQKLLYQHLQSGLEVWYIQPKVFADQTWEVLLSEVSGHLLRQSLPCGVGSRWTLRC